MRSPLTICSAHCSAIGGASEAMCAARSQALVDADVYVEDNPSNITDLQKRNRLVVACTNSTKSDIAAIHRADDWAEAERLIRKLRLEVEAKE